MQRARGVHQINPVSVGIDAKCLAQFPRARQQVSVVCSASTLSHQLNPRDRFCRANQNGGSVARPVCHDVEHPVDAVIEVDVGQSWAIEHHAIALGNPAVRVTPRVVWRAIGLNFDNLGAKITKNEVRPQ